MITLRMRIAIESLIMIAIFSVLYVEVILLSGVSWFYSLPIMGITGFFYGLLFSWLRLIMKAANL